MKGGQSPSLELVSREFRKQGLAPWAADRGPDPPFAAMVFWCSDTVLQEVGKVSKRTRASWQVADEGRAKSKFGAIVSRGFRKQRLEPWAADRGPDPSFAATVFWCSDTVLQEVGKVSKRTRASWQVADEGRAKSKFGASF